MDKDSLEEFTDLYEEWIDVPNACAGEYIRTAKRLVERNYQTEFVGMTVEPFILNYRHRGKLYKVRMGANGAFIEYVPETATEAA